MRALLDSKLSLAFGESGDPLAAESANFSSEFERGSWGNVATWWNAEMWYLTALLPEMIFFGTEESLDNLETPIHPFYEPPNGQTSDNMDRREIIRSFNFNSFNTTITDGRSEVLQWLSPLEPQKRHQHLRGERTWGCGTMDFPNRRVQEMGYGRRWLFSFCALLPRWSMCGEDSSQVTRNRGRELPSLTCDFSSAVIDHFCSRRQDVTVAGLYCDYLDRNEQTTVRTGIIGPDSRTLELPLLVWFGSFFFFFCLKLGLRRSLFAVRSPPYPREGISNVLARGPIIPVSTVHRTC